METNSRRKLCDGALTRRPGARLQPPTHPPTLLSSAAPSSLVRRVFGLNPNELKWVCLGSATKAGQVWMTNSADLCEHGEEGRNTSRRRRRRRIQGQSSITNSSYERRIDRISLSARQLDSECQREGEGQDETREDRKRSTNWMYLKRKKQHVKCIRKFVTVITNRNNSLDKEYIYTSLLCTLECFN